MDEGPAHRLLVLRETLAEVFGNRVVALQNEVDSLYSHQTLLHATFSWGYMKSQVLTRHH